jgi:hypothetical protein
MCKVYPVAGSAIKETGTSYSAETEGSVGVVIKPPDPLVERVSV